MNYDVIALGELLIDFTLAGVSDTQNLLLEACPGGAPCNVLSMLTKLGRKTGFIGKVGDDQFGHMLCNILQDMRIDTTSLLLDQEVNTTLAFVHTFADGNRDFSFYRNPGADMMLQPDEVDEKYLKQTKIFHFGTLSMTDEPVREATKKATKIAKDNGIMISFDPNLRPPLWKDLREAKARANYGFSVCDILKISDNEVEFYTGLEDYDAGILHLQKTYGTPLIFLTLGKQGSRAYFNDLRVEVPGFSVNTIETTGAGDTFCACILDGVLTHGIEDLSYETLENMLFFANAAAALITTKRGALLSMPSKEEVMRLKCTLEFCR